MIDPLAEVVSLLQPVARFSKLVEAAGEWQVQGPATGEPFYCALLEGQVFMSIHGQPPIAMQQGDFILVPAMHELRSASRPDLDPARSDAPTVLAPGHIRLGDTEATPQVRMRLGHCIFGSPDAALLVSLLPQVVHVRDQPRLTTLVQLLVDENRAQRPGREIVLERLLEVMLIEALRSADTPTAPGLARGLADERLALALRALHERPAHAWTVPELANEAALSRSAFFARFSRTVGVAPMEYLLAWRMALAKRLLRAGDTPIAQVAEQVGYSSASTFSVAFARHVGVPPGRYGQQAAA